MVSGISLANKCQLLFGFAVLLIVAAALSVPWIWTQQLVRESQADVARLLADAWLEGEIKLGSVWYEGLPRDLSDLLAEDDDQTLWLTFVRVREIEAEEESDPFIRAALNRFQDDAEQFEHIHLSEVDGRSIYRYARAIKESQMRALRDPVVANFSTSPFDRTLANIYQGFDFSL